MGLLAGAAYAQENTVDAARWLGEASRVTITRDDWGIAHVHGKSDADAVFGMIYAQCEDDFNRVETNYLNSLGRLAEAEGKTALWSDLRQRLFIDPDQLQEEYAGSPAWLKALMDAWADGINFYLAKHPEVQARVLKHWEPWMALSFTEGSIGGDIERIDLKKLQAFYDRAGAPPLPPSQPSPQPVSEVRVPALRQDEPEREPGGSNGFAVAPQNTHDHHALLLINPHTSFFFRSELQMTSDAGLNAYGAVTWGQPFVYQGFNERAGWMHTSSNVDAVDEYVEHVRLEGGKLNVQYDKTYSAMGERQITLRYRNEGSGMGTRTFTVYATQHGPVVRTDDAGRWVAVRLMQRHVAALEQSYGRTKGAQLCGVSQDDGADGEQLQQHDLCGCGRLDRVLARQLHPAAGHALRLYEAGGRD